MNHSFNAEIQQLLDLMIHSLYSQKEIFLRELVSNASDALDKLKFQSLTHPDLLPAGHEFQIRIEADKTAKTLKIIDSGIGMSSAEVQEYIGTIARSGTKKFQQMNQEMKSRPELIGQFGVGFYSSFMVAERVVLHTQKAGESEGILWESEGKGNYTLQSVPRAEGVGTSITLKLKEFPADENVDDFSDAFVLKSLVKKYSDFIPYPIKMKNDKGEEETLNSQKALWLKPAAEVTQDEYKEFYQHLTHDWNSPLKTIHYKAEGTMEFSALLFIPEKKPWNLMYKDQEFGLSLYVKKVFIMADTKDLIMPYLRFVRGLVDSSDLSLNVSREMLQQDRQVTQIRKNVVTKVLGTLKDMLIKDRPSYENFWTEFGQILKEGVPTDHANKEKLQDLLLVHSSHSDKMTTLDEYVGRMKPEQKHIFYMTGDDLAQMAQSPYLERLKEKSFEVIFFNDAIDEWVTQSLTEYKGKKLHSVMKENLDLDSESETKEKEEKQKVLSENYKDILEEMKTSLKDFVKDVKISDRLKSTPVCLVAGEHDPSARMQKIYSQMGQGGSPFGEGKRILEVNFEHPVFEKMKSASSDLRKDWIEILYSQALLHEGSPLPNPTRYTELISNLMLRN